MGSKLTVSFAIFFEGEIEMKLIQQSNAKLRMEMSAHWWRFLPLGQQEKRSGLTSERHARKCKNQMQPQTHVGSLIRPVFVHLTFMGK